MVFIGPCISKKAEAESVSKTVDCVLTFEELHKWFDERHITPEPIPDPEGEGGKSRFFPTDGGILKSMDCDAADYSYISVDGMEACKQALEDISSGRLHHCFVEMSACTGGCIGGPAMGDRRQAILSDTNEVYRYATDGAFAVPALSEKEMETEHPFLNVPRQKPGKQAIEEVLRKLGKTRPEDELNCGCCGYDTCRAKAEAVLEGKADLTMCLPYLKEKAENFSEQIIQNTPNGILVLNEDLVIQQINKAACDLLHVPDSSAVRNEQVVRVLDPTPFFKVMQTGINLHNERTYLAEYQKYVEETVLHDRDYHLILVILRDITGEETTKIRKDSISRQTIEITDKVVDKQMRVVQEIASLLGETAAETKIALTKLKESLKDE